MTHPIGFKDKIYVNLGHGYTYVVFVDTTLQVPLNSTCCTHLTMNTER